MNVPNFRLDNQVAIITGASRGIGYGLAKMLAAAGATVAVASRDKSALDRLVAEIQADGGNAAAFEVENGGFHRLANPQKLGLFGNQIARRLRGAHESAVA